MASAKKRRGRERKAAKKKDNNGGDGRAIVVGANGIGISSINWINEIREGSKIATSSAIEWYGSHVHDRQHLLRAGLLDVTLNYLGRCNASFDSVMRDIGGELG